MADQRPDDPMGILLPQQQRITTPFLVTFQAQFKVEARNKEQAEHVVERGISIMSQFVPHMISLGAIAEPLTEQMLAAMKAEMEKQK